MTVDQRVLRLKVTLLGIRPPIWRRIEGPMAISLSDLHGTLQAAMGWADCHLHQASFFKITYSIGATHTVSPAIGAAQR